MIPVTQLGRIAQDVELKTIELNGGENVVVNNALAIRLNKETTVYIDFTAWGKLAESIATTLHKGNEIILTGELRNKKNKVKFEDKEKEITSVFLLVKGFEFTHGNNKQV